MRVPDCRRAVLVELTVHMAAPHQATRVLSSPFEVRPADLQDRGLACALSSDEQPLRLGLRDGGLSWPAIDVRQWMRGGSRKALRNTQLAVWSQKSKER